MLKVRKNPISFREEIKRVVFYASSYASSLKRDRKKFGFLSLREERMKAVNTLEKSQTTTETSTTIKTLSKAPKAALTMMMMMFVGVFSVVALFNDRMMILFFSEENNGSRVVMFGTTLVAISVGSAFVFYEKRKRRTCAATNAGDGARSDAENNGNNTKSNIAERTEEKKNKDENTINKSSSQPGSPVTPPQSSSKTSASNAFNSASGSKKGSRNKGGAKEVKIDDEALEEFKLQQERLKNERLERERMIFEREETERIAREAKEKELIEKRRLRALEHEAELEKLRLKRLAEKEVEEKKKLEEEAKSKAKESSYNTSNEMHQQHNHHVAEAQMYQHQQQQHRGGGGGPTSPKQIPSPHFNQPKPPPGPPPEHVVRAVRAKQQMTSATTSVKMNETPLPPMAPIHLDELHKDKAAQREISRSAVGPPPGFGSIEGGEHLSIGGEDRGHQPAHLLVHQRTDSFASDGALNDVLGLTFSSLGDDVFGPFDDDDDIAKVRQPNVTGQPPLPPGPPPAQPLAAQQMPNNTEVREWLRMLNLEQFAEIFERESIVMSDLVLLRERDLESLGLPLGPRRRIAASVAYMSTTTTASTNTNSANTAATTNGPPNSSPTPPLPPQSLSSRGAGHDRSPSKDGFLHQNQMLYHGYSASDGLFEVDVDDLTPVVEEEPSIKEPSPIMVEAAAKIKIASATMKVPQEFYDCITCEVMLEPVITSDGHSYDRNSIARWLEKHDTSPITGEKLAQKKLTLNHSLRSSILAFADDYCAPLPRE